MTMSIPSEQSTVITNRTATESLPVTTISTTEPVNVPEESSRNQVSNSAATTTPVEAERTPCNSYITASMYDHNKR